MKTRDEIGETILAFIALLFFASPFIALAF